MCLLYRRCRLLAFVFYGIKGVRYHKTYGKHIAATLILQDKPLIELSENMKDTFFGYWNETFYVQDMYRDEAQTVTDGINYRINRNLFSNVQFRSFTSSFFFMVANAEKKYILKDIGRTIKAWGYYLPSISLKSTLSCHSPSEMMSLVASEDNLLNMNFNKADMNVGYVIRKLLSFISSIEIFRRSYLMVSLPAIDKKRIDTIMFNIYTH